MVDDHVDAPSSRQLPDGLRPRDRLVVHEDIRAEGLRLLELLVRRTRHEDRASGQFGDLDGGRREPRSRSEDQDVLARADLRATHEHPPGGHERQGRRGRGLEGQVCGNLQGVPRRDGDLFRVRPRKVLAEDPVIDAGGVVALHAIFTAPARDPRVQDDAVPDLEVRDVRAHRRDVAGPVRTEDVREGELEGRNSFPDEQVEVIQGRGVDADHNLVRPGDRIRIVLHPLEDLGPAVLRQDDGLQRTTCATSANEAVLDKGRRQRTLYPFCWRRRTTSLRWSPCRTITPCFPYPPVASPSFSSLASFSASSGFDSRPRTTVTAFPYRRVSISTDSWVVSRPRSSQTQISLGNPQVAQIPAIKPPPMGSPS